MKTKNVRIRLKDIRKGKTVYIAHPKFGVVRAIINSKPFMNRDIGLFVHVLEENEYFEGGYYETTKSLSDMGVYNVYNYRRTFHNHEQAERYVDRYVNDKGFLEHWERHLKSVDRTFSNWNDIYAPVDDDDLVDMDDYHA
ncbi:MAG: hypothetical protein CL489_08570 [Acidobacteria bacterium]|nr:hypothetical protein [Acidobacteriota bacterium]